MNVNIRYPNITGRSEGEQILQVRSYLYQLVEQLNVALRSVEETTTSNGASAQNDNASYYELRALVYQEIKRIEQMLENGYVKDEEVSDMINSALNSVLADIDDKVDYTKQQSLSTSQKDQARENIGAAPLGYNVSKNTVATSADLTTLLCSIHNELEVNETEYRIINVTSEATKLPVDQYICQSTKLSNAFTRAIVSSGPYTVGFYIQAV